MTDDLLLSRSIRGHLIGVRPAVWYQGEVLGLNGEMMMDVKRRVFFCEQVRTFSNVCQSVSEQRYEMMRAKLVAALALGSSRSPARKDHLASFACDSGSGSSRVQTAESLRPGSDESGSPFITRVQHPQLRSECTA